MRSKIMSLNSKNSQTLHQKYFPQVSPRKPRQKMPTIYRHKYVDKQFSNQQAIHLPRSEISLATNPTRLDQSVQIQRRQMIIKTGRNSIDNPQWMNNTLHHYKKSNFSPVSKHQLIQQRNYDPLNSMRKSNYIMKNHRNQDHYYRQMIRNQINPTKHNQFNNNTMIVNTNTSQSSNQTHMRSTLGWISKYQRDVSPKVGAQDIRDYSIRKPLLKIGKNQYINTYSPFQHF